MADDREPIDLDARRMARGEPAFLVCPACQSELGWFVVCVMTAKGPVISNLVCEECTVSLDVLDGHPAQEGVRRG